MDQEAQLPGKEPERARLFVVEHFVDAVDLDEVIARAERAHLIAAATERRLRDAIGLGPLELAALFVVREIGGAAEPALDRPRCAILEHSLDLAAVERADRVRGSHARRDV